MLPLLATRQLFPQVIGRVATWDTDLAHTMRETVSIEARAKDDRVRRANSWGRSARLGCASGCPRLAVDLICCQVAAGRSQSISFACEPNCKNFSTT